MFDGIGLVHVLLIKTFFYTYFFLCRKHVHICVLLGLMFFSNKMIL